MQPRWHEPSNTPEGELLAIVKSLEEAVLGRDSVMKYQQESSVENASPQFMDHSGGTPVEAHPFQTNGMIPAFTDVAPERSPISEKAKIFAFAKTGYDETGTGLHMQLSDGGDRKDGNWNIAPVEELLTTLNKSGGDSGLLSEIADLVEKIATQA